MPRPPLALGTKPAVMHRPPTPTPMVEEHDPVREKLEASKMWTQQLPGWMPLYSPSWVISGFVIFGPVFAAIGIWIIVTSEAVVEIPLQYDNLAACTKALSNSPCAVGKSLSPDDDAFVPQDPLCWRSLNFTEQATCANECAIIVEIPEDMPKPVYFYYELKNFYQNQRVYVKSQAPRQLKGDDIGDSVEDYRDALYKSCGSSSGLDKCTSGLVPSPPSDEVGGYKTSIGERYLCNPCGLVARSFFTDTFQMCKSTDGTSCAGGGAYPGPHHLTGTEWTKEGITWATDTSKFKPAKAGNKHNMRTKAEDALVADPDFIVWMRTAGLSHFRKLYRVINRDLMKGEKFVVQIRNNFDVGGFGGEKSFVLSTVDWAGGKNPFFGWLYLLFGGVLFCLGVIFLATHLIHQSRMPPGADSFVPALGYFNPRP